MLRHWKHYGNLYGSTFIIIFHHSERLSCKMSLLEICKILGLFFNTLTADGKYSLCNTDSLWQQNQMQLSK